MGLDKRDELFYKKWVYLIAVVFLVAGSINWLLIGALGYNLVEAIFGRSIGRAVYIIVGISALFLMFNRDLYLPFLGESVAPCAAFSDRVPPGATKEVVIYAPPGAKVLYWAAEPAMDGLKQMADWKTAYASYENAGLATADSQGRASLLVRAPQGYNVPGKKLPPHVHYRICEPKGWLGRVQTKFVDNEGFMDLSSITWSDVKSASGSLFAMASL
jgi:uncharacterized membrane protein YuzA (DUF378 family)